MHHFFVDTLVLQPFDCSAAHTIKPLSHWSPYQSDMAPNLQVHSSVPGLQRAIGASRDSAQSLVLNSRRILPIYLVEGHWAQLATHTSTDCESPGIPSSVSYLCRDLAEWITIAKGTGADAAGCLLPQDIQAQLNEALALPPQARAQYFVSK
jgi:hypothetical protein